MTAATTTADRGDTDVLKTVADYRQVRAQIRPGDVILFSGTTRTAWLIQRATHSNLSHAGIVTWAPAPEGGAAHVQTWYRVYVTDSTMLGGRKGVDTRLLSETLARAADRNTVVYWFPLAQAVRERMDEGPLREYLYAMQGRDYDLWQAARLGVRLVFGRNAVPIRESGKNLFCSEFVAFAFRHGRIWDFPNPSVVSPIDVARIPVYSPFGYEQLTGDHFVPVRGVRN